VTHISGCNVQSLLVTGYEDGLPPYLVFHILKQVYQHSIHLKQEDLYHSDLAAGGNVMLYRRSFDKLPFVTLVDFEGVQDISMYLIRKMHPILKPAGSMTREKSPVSRGYQVRKDETALDDQDLEDTNDIYYEISKLAGKST
jgi:hypothetical protein